MEASEYCITFEVTCIISRVTHKDQTQAIGDKYLTGYGGRQRSLMKQSDGGGDQESASVIVDAYALLCPGFCSVCALTCSSM